MFVGRLAGCSVAPVVRTIPAIVAVTTTTTCARNVFARHALPRPDDVTTSASHKIDRKLKTRVSILLLVCLAMPAASEDTGLDHTSGPVALLTIKYCGNVLLAENPKNNEIHVSSEFLNSTRDIEILERVKTQLEVARNHFRNINEKVAHLYSTVKNVMKTDYNYEWLPSRSLDWYKEYINKHDKDTQVLLLSKLRDSLHNFLVTLDQMRKFNKSNDMFISTERKSLLDDLSKHLNVVLCEVETALVTLSSWQSKEAPPDTERTVTVGGPGWDPNPDYTTMMIQDWGVLTTYYCFLKNWRYISLRMVDAEKRLTTSADPQPADSFSVAAAVTSGRLSLVLLQQRRQHHHHHRHHHRRQHHRPSRSKHTRRTTPDSAVT